VKVYVLGSDPLNHEDVVNVGELRIMPRYIGEFGV